MTWSIKRQGCYFRLNKRNEAQVGTRGWWKIQPLFWNSLFTNYLRAGRDLTDPFIKPPPFPLRLRGWSDLSELVKAIQVGLLYLDSCPFPCSQCPNSLDLLITTQPTARKSALSAERLYKLTEDMCTFGVRRRRSFSSSSASALLAQTSHFSLCLFPLLVRRR